MWVSLPSGRESAGTARSSMRGAYLRIWSGLSKATPLGGAVKPAWVGLAEWHILQWVETMAWTSAKCTTPVAATGLGLAASAAMITAMKIMQPLTSTIGWVRPEFFRLKKNRIVQPDAPIPARSSQLIGLETTIG